MIFIKILPVMLKDGLTHQIMMQEEKRPLLIGKKQKNNGLDES